MKTRGFFIVIIMLLMLNNNIMASFVDSIKTDLQHWTYFGWEEDHPKAISLMGGALYARRPKLANGDNESWNYSKKAWHQDSDKPVFFMLSVDESLPYYPNEQSPLRKKNIKWELAEGYLPFPTSTWVYKDIEVKIMHIGRRLFNNNLNAVFTKVVMTNTGKRTHKAALQISGKSVSERIGELKKSKLIYEKDLVKLKPVTLKPGKSVFYEFVLPANGEGRMEDIIELGNFNKHFEAEKKRIESIMNTLTMPQSLPDDRYIDLWKSSMLYMWNATVKTPVDYEQRGSGGNVYGYYQYDRTFDHDVPDMVIQYIIEGNWDIAKQIMNGATYERLSSGKLQKEDYLDAIPKYIITHAQYLQFTNDIEYFDCGKVEKLKRCALAIAEMREKQFSEEAKRKGVYGLIRKGHTLDNNHKTYLLVDNFAALHGYTAYKYICNKLDLKDEANWANEQMIDLNDCLNNAIRKSISESGLQWYNACFSFDMDYNLVSGPGNWLGTSFSMPTFPWNAQLKGFDLGGEWLTYLDRSVEKWMEVAKFYGCPDGSFGAWWNAKYGTVYNTGMVMSLLTSDKYRTLIPKSIDWLLDNQSGPLIWGESFHKPRFEGDWTRPEVDLETWGLGFIRQGMIQMCVSVKANSDVIIGRGIPNEWLNSQKKIAWRNVHISGGKKINLSIQKKDAMIEVTIDGDTNNGAFIVDFPICKDNIKDVDIVDGTLVSTDVEKGSVVVSGNTKVIKIMLNN